MALRRTPSTDQVGDDDGIIADDLAVDPDFFVRDLSEPEARSTPTPPRAAAEPEPAAAPVSDPEPVLIDSTDEHLEALADALAEKPAETAAPSPVSDEPRVELRGRRRDPVEPWVPQPIKRRVVVPDELRTPPPLEPINLDDLPAPTGAAHVPQLRFMRLRRVVGGTSLTVMVIVATLAIISFGLVYQAASGGGGHTGKVSTWGPGGVPSSGKTAPAATPPAATPAPARSKAPTHKRRHHKKKAAKDPVVRLTPAPATQAPTVPRYHPPAAGAANREFGL